jgi:hypothetical protein
VVVEHGIVLRNSTPILPLYVVVVGEIYENC